MVEISRWLSEAWSLSQNIIPAKNLIYFLDSQWFAITIRPAMRQIITADRTQTHLLPPCVDDWLCDDHPARFIAEFVEQLDLRQLGFDELNRDEGGSAYAPALLLAVWLYGYYDKRSSTRALEKSCRENMAYIWLAGNQHPDHNSLWRFWNEHRAHIRRLFKQTLKLAMKMNLVGMVAQALDGTKIAAACGKKSCDMKKLEGKTTLIDEQIAEIEKQIKEAGNQAADKLPRALANKKALKEQIEKAKQRVRQKETKSANPQEPDATLMKNGPAYNAQAVADTQTQIVVAADLTNQISDQEQTLPMMEQARANLQEATGQSAPERAPQASQVQTLADTNYASQQNFHKAVAGKHALLTPPPSAWSDISDPYHAAHFKHDRENNHVICPQGRVLTHRGTRQDEGVISDIYGKRRECDGCPVKARCTKRQKDGRQVNIAREGHEEMVRRRAEWERAEVRQKYGRRAPTIEPVFAQIKNVMGFRRWTVKGLEKVSAQWQMLCASWNLKVILRYWRAQKAMEAAA